jgi:hypothetical protein
MGKHVWTVAVVALVAAACGGRVTEDCQFCGSECVDTKTNILDCGGCGQPCAVGQSCQDGVCTDAPPSTIGCNDPSLYNCGNGVCTDLLSDPKNCYYCGFECGDGEECLNGACKKPPPTCEGTGFVCKGDGGKCCSGVCGADGRCTCMYAGGMGCVKVEDCCSKLCTEQGKCL